MQSNLPRFAKSFGIFMLGALVGIVAATYGVSEVFARVQDGQFDRGYVAAANEGSLMLRLLNDVDARETGKVSRHLDFLVDNYTLILGNYAATNKENDNNRFAFVTLASIREYRRAHPSQTVDPAFRQRVERVLAEQTPDTQ
jgi:hypothetical protein